MGAIVASVAFKISLTGRVDIVLISIYNAYEYLSQAKDKNTSPPALLQLNYTSGSTYS